MNRQKLRWTPEADAILIAAFKAGRSDREIADEVNASTGWGADMRSVSSRRFILRLMRDPCQVVANDWPRVPAPEKACHRLLTLIARDPFHRRAA